jgi:integrase
MAKRRGTGEGSIFQRQDGRWCGILNLGWEAGRRRRWHCYAETQREVIAKIDDAKAKLKTGLPIDAPASAVTPASGQKVSDVLSAWLDIIKPEVKPRTFRGYRDFVVLHAIPIIGAIAADKISTANMVELIKAKVAGGMAPNSIKHLRTTIKAAFSWACENNLMTSNPAAAKKLGMPRLTQRKGRFLTESEARQLLTTATGHRIYPLISLALHSGCRLGEALGAKWTDIDLDAGTFRIQRTLQRVPGEGLRADTTKTKTSNRVIYLAPEMAKVLISHRRAQAAERLSAGPLWSDRGWVFTNPTTGAALDPSNIHKSWKAVVAATGLGDLHFHDLRATCGSLLLQAGVNLKEVSTLLGHASVRITGDLYVGLYESTRREVAATLGAVLAKP